MRGVAKIVGAVNKGIAVVQAGVDAYGRSGTETEGELFAAISERDSKRTEELCVSMGSSPNLGSIDCLNRDDKTPLMLAVELQYGDVVSVLLDKGANFLKMNAKWRDALAFACVLPDDSMAKLLLDWVKENSRYKIHLNVAISEVARRGDFERARLLFEDKYCGYAGGKGNDVLYSAVNKGDVGFVNWLISKSFPKKASSKGGDSELICAVKKNYKDITLLMIEYKADLERYSAIDSEWNSYTALMLAARSGYYDIAKLLIERGASIERCYHNVDRSTKVRSLRRPALALAVQSGSEQIIQLLLQYGADCSKVKSTPYLKSQIIIMSKPQQRIFYLPVTMVNRLGELYRDNKIAFPQDAANIDMVLKDVENGVAGVESFLLEADAERFKSLSNGWSSKLLSLVRKAFDDGVCVNDKVLRVCSELLEKINNDDSCLVDIICLLQGSDKDKLFRCVEYGCVALARQLLKRAKDKEFERDDSGQSLLMKAVLLRSEQMVEFLLKRRASVTEADNSGKTPLQLLALKDELSLVESTIAIKLLERDAIICYLDDWAGRLLALLAGAKDAKAEIYIKSMLENGVGPDHFIFWDGRRRAAVEIAVNAGNASIIALLISYDVTQGFEGVILPQDDAKTRSRLKDYYFKILMKQKCRQRLYYNSNYYNGNLADMYSNGKVKLPSDKPNIRQVLQDYMDGISEVFAFLTLGTNPAPFEPLKIWVHLLTEFARTVLLKCSPQAHMFLRLLSKMGKNNEYLLPIVKDLREGLLPDSGEVLRGFYALGFLPVPVNEQEFKVLIGSNAAIDVSQDTVCVDDSKYYLQDILGFLINNAEQLQLHWLGEETLVGFLWNQYIAEKDVRVLLILASIDSSYGELQECVCSWRSSIEDLMMARQFDEEGAVTPEEEDRTLDNLRRLYSIGKIERPDTRVKLECCFKDFRSLNILTGDPSSVFTFLKGFFKDASIEKTKLLTEIADEDLEGLFLNAIKMDHNNSVSYINLLKALKPQWWSVDTSGLQRKKGKGRVRELLRGELFVNKVKQQLKLLSDKNAEKKLPENIQQKDGDDGSSYEDKRPPSYVEKAEALSSWRKIPCEIMGFVVYDPVSIFGYVYERSAIEYYYEIRLSLLKEGRIEDILLPHTQTAFTLSNIDEAESLRIKIDAWERAGYREEPSNADSSDESLKRGDTSSEPTSPPKPIFFPEVPAHLLSEEDGMSHDMGDNSVVESENGGGGFR